METTETAEVISRMTTTSPSKVAVDLCNTIAQINREIEKRFGPRPDPLQLHHPVAAKPGFWHTFEAQKIFEEARPYPGAREAVWEIYSRFGVIYLTSRPDWAHQTSRQWLEKNGFPRAPIVCTGDKKTSARKYGVSAAIEDSPRQIEALMPLVPVLVPAREYNACYPGRFFNWEEAVKFLERREEVGHTGPFSSGISKEAALSG